MVYDFFHKSGRIVEIIILKNIYYEKVINGLVAFMYHSTLCPG
jgi:hypothetical protein